MAAGAAFTALVGRLAPIQEALAALVTAEPPGGVARILSHLHRAVTHLGAGDLAAVRAEVLTAHISLAEVLSTTTPDPQDEQTWWRL